MSCIGPQCSDKGPHCPSSFPRFTLQIASKGRDVGQWLRSITSSTTTTTCSTAGCRPKHVDERDTFIHVVLLTATLIINLRSLSRPSLQCRWRVTHFCMGRQENRRIYSYFLIKFLKQTFYREFIWHI